MPNLNCTEWTARAAAQAVLASEKSKNQVATEAAIPYRTLDRKLRGGTPFNWSELLRIAEVTGVPANRFTPPPFQHEQTAA